METKQQSTLILFRAILVCKMREREVGVCVKEEVEVRVCVEVEGVCVERGREVLGGRDG